MSTQRFEGLIKNLGVRLKLLRFIETKAKDAYAPRLRNHIKDLEEVLESLKS